MPENHPSNHHCKRCGEAIATASPTGLCPGCMFGGALGLEPSESFEIASGLDSTDPSFFTAPIRVEAAPDPLEGTRIGRYKILQRIGEGGFGLVYMAEQVESVHRKVALKVIKAGMDTKQVIARFEAERQALAMMDHPNIARFLDVGETAEGRPFFVMELVKGRPVTHYCQEKKLTTEARIELFLQICRAVQHAHVKGIIHRDLKPSNILITVQDGQPIPKVIDFGIAKAMDQRLTDKTLFTRFEHMLGTPAYMSPEQVALSAVDVDTRSDVYALGVLLYELLTGTPPFDAENLRSAVADEMRRMIREDEPPRPSTRLTQLKSAADNSDERASLPSSEIARDLDWIVMKALEKDRSRRYDTANDLARDIERFVSNEPVEAGAPGMGYRARKFIRRHRIGVMTGSAIFAAIVIGAALAIAGQLEAQRGRAVAVEAQKKAEKAEAETKREAAISRAVNAFLSDDLLAQANPYNTPGEQDITLNEVLDRAAAKVDERFAAQPEVRASLHHTLAKTYEGIGKFKEAEEHARQAAELSESLHGFQYPSTLAAFSLWAQVLSHSNYQSSLALHRRVFEGRRDMLGAAHPATLRTQARIGSLIGHMGENQQAVVELRAVLETQVKVLGEHHEDVRSTKQALMRQLHETRSPEFEGEAIALGRQVVADLEICCGADHPKRLAAMHILATMLSSGHQYEEAENLYRQVLEKKRELFGEDHPDTLVSKGNLGILLASLNRTEEAIALLEQSISNLDENESDSEEATPATLAAHYQLAFAYAKAGRRQEAITRFEHVIQSGSQVFGTDHPNMLVAMDALAAQYAAIDATDKAVALGESVLEKAKKQFGDEHPGTIYYSAQLAYLLGRAGRHEEAEQRMREVCDTAEKVLGSENLETAAYLAKLGDIMMDSPNFRDRYREMIPIYRRSLAIRELQLPPTDPSVLETKENWIICRKNAGESLSPEEQKISDEIFKKMFPQQPTE